MASGRSSLSIAEANERVEELVRTIHEFLKVDTNLTPNEIIKGGSLGQGTAVPGKFDLDLVLCSENIKADIMAARGAANILNKLDNFLRKRLRGSYTFINKTPFALQFKLHGDIEVDLLPSPYWGEFPENYHRYIKDKDESTRRKFSCGATKWQVQFFKKQPNEVKEYIKRLKAWRNYHWARDMEGRPKSYLLGLLMIRAYEKSSSKAIDSIERELKAMIKNHKDIYIEWNDPLDRKEFLEDKYAPSFLMMVPNFYAHQTASASAPTMSRPAVVDVGNPFNNLYKSGINGDWTEFARLIDAFNLHTPPNDYEYEP